MHRQSTPYEITFDSDAASPLTVPAPASSLDLAAHAIDHLAGSGAVQADVHLAAGRLTVADDAGTVIAAGRITGPGVGPATPADLSAVTDLLTPAGWVLDYTDDGDGGAEHGYLHPSGREIIATPRLGDLVDLHLTDLTPEQVAGAVTGAGLAPTEVGLTDAETALAEVLALLDRLDDSGQDYDTDLIRGVVPERLRARVAELEAQQGGEVR